jgi:hypothetical protein
VSKIALQRLQGDYIICVSPHLHKPPPSSPPPLFLSIDTITCKPLFLGIEISFPPLVISFISTIKVVPILHASPALLTACQLEKKKLEYEYLKEQRRRFEAEMELIDLQSRRDEEEINRLSTEVKYGKHSQPATPPEYSNHTGFPTSLSRPNRFSMSSITGMTTPRSGRSGSQLTSPPSAPANGSFNPSKSVPGSRRNSDEDKDERTNEDMVGPTQYRR